MIDKQTIRSKGFFKAIGLEFLICQGVALVIALILYTYGNTGDFRMTLRISIIYSNLNWLFINVFFFLFHLKWRGNLPWQTSHILKSALALFLAITVATEIGTWIVVLMLKRDFIPFLSLWHLYLTLMNFVISLIVVTLMGLYKSLQFRIESRDQDYEELENLQIKTRLAALQAKLNPHFLFNTLNVILDLANQAPEKIEPVVLNLSDIYRTVLGQAENAQSTLGDEIDLVRKYLEIEKIRLGKRLRFEIVWDERLAGQPLPPLLIEPLVENAVIHGISPKPAGGVIKLSVGRVDDRLRIDIADDGVGLVHGNVGHVHGNVGYVHGNVGYVHGNVGMTPVNPDKGFGLQSVRERMHLIYGPAGTMTITAGADGGTRVNLEVPFAP